MSGGALLPRAGGDPRPADEVREALDNVLDRLDLDDEPSLLDAILEWLNEHMKLDFGPGVAQVVENVLAVLAGVFVALFLALLVRYFVLRRYASLTATAEARAPQASARARAAELRALAREARLCNDERLALRLLLFALVVGLGQRGDLRYRDSWTNRELVERGNPSPAVRALLGPLIAELEAKEFGGAPVVAADVDRLERLCDQWLGREPGGPGEERT